MLSHFVSSAHLIISLLMWCLPAHATLYPEIPVYRRPGHERDRLDCGAGWSRGAAGVDEDTLFPLNGFRGLFCYLLLLEIQGKWMWLPWLLANSGCRVLCRCSS